MKVDAAQLAEIWGVDDRTVTNWVNMRPPCPSTKRNGRRWFDTAKVAKWREETVVRRAVAVSEPADFEKARARKMEADARKAEIELAELEGSMLTLSEHQTRLAAICERIRGVLMAVPSKYLSRIQISRTDIEAQAVGEAIRDETLLALQGSADDLELEGVAEVA